MNDTFQALSSTVRRKILAYLSKTDLTAGEISERFEMSKPAMSKHLSILMNAGLIAAEKKGQFVHYSLVKENLFANMNDFLVNFCPQGRPLKMESAEIAKSREKVDGVRGLKYTNYVINKLTPLFGVGDWMSNGSAGAGSMAILGICQGLLADTTQTIHLSIRDEIPGFASLTRNDLATEGGNLLGFTPKLSIISKLFESR